MGKKKLKLRGIPEKKIKTSKNTKKKKRNKKFKFTNN